MNNSLNMDVVVELASLGEDGDPGFIADLVDMFLEDAPCKIHGVLSALANQDFAEIKRHAHALKGVAGTLGAIVVESDCESLLVGSSQKHLGLCQKAATALQEHFAEAAQALRGFLGRSP